MKIHPSITLERIEEALSGDLCTGFCCACGEEAFGVEPDARRYECMCCEAKAVFGAEELLFHVAF